MAHALELGTQCPTAAGLGGTGGTHGTVVGCSPRAVWQVWAQGVLQGEEAPKQCCGTDANAPRGREGVSCGSFRLSACKLAHKHMPRGTPLHRRTQPAQGPPPRALGRLSAGFGCAFSRCPPAPGRRHLQGPATRCACGWCSPMVSSGQEAEPRSSQHPDTSAQLS